MKKSMSKIVSLLVVGATVLAMASGCSKPPVENGVHKLQLPAAVQDAMKPDATEDKTPAIRFYFNNTVYTKWFFSKPLAENNGTYVRGEFAENKSVNTAKFINAVKDSFDEKYETTAYAIDNSAKDGWKWKEDSAVYGKSVNDQSFFVSTSYDEKNMMKGLIESFKTDSDINIYLTSLMELGNNISDLTKWLKGSINAGEDYSACILCVLCDYNGKIYQTGDYSAEVENKEVTGKKPLYLIMTGPSAALESYAGVLDSSMKSAGFDGKNDYGFYFFPEIEPENIKNVTDEVVIPDSFKPHSEFSPNQLKELVAASDFNTNVNLTPYNKTEYGSVLNGVDNYLDMFVFRYEQVSAEKASPLTKDMMLLNMYVPLYDCTDDMGERYRSFVYTDADKVGDADIFSAYYFDPAAEAADGTNTANAAVTGGESSAAPVPAPAEGVLVSETPLSYFDFEKKGFKLTTAIVDGGDVPEFVMNEVPTSLQNVTAGTAKKLDDSHKWLKITVEYKFDSATAKNTASLILNIPVYAILDNVLPGWSDNCSCSLNEYSVTDEGALAKTVNLEAFMDSIVTDGGSEEEYTAQFREEIANIAVCICDIPVA